MSDSRTPLSSEVRALLERERAIPALSPHVRARSLARARAALLAGRVTPPAGYDTAGRGGHAGLVKVAAVCVVSAAIGAVAYRMANQDGPPAIARPAPSVRAIAAPPSPSPLVPSVAVAPAPQPPASSVAAPSPATVPTPQRAIHGDAPDELRLLRQARAAVSRGQLVSALARIGEHARRFENGRLSEEREALRVKALSGLGRTAEARRAAEAFETRFPRSVLLPAVRQMTGSGP